MGTSVAGSQTTNDNKRYDATVTEVGSKVSQDVNLLPSGSFADPHSVSGCISSWWFGDNGDDDEFKVYDNVGINHLDCINIEDADITRA